MINSPLSDLFRLRLLSEYSYLLERLQSAYKIKMHPKAKYKTHPLLLETEATLMFQQMTYIDAYIYFISVTSCSPHNAKMTIGRYQRNVLISQYRLLADYRCICNINHISRIVKNDIINIKPVMPRAKQNISAI